MTFGITHPRVAGLALAIGFAAMIGGCDSKPIASGEVKVDASLGAEAAKPVDVAASPPVSAAAKRPADNLDGIWRVSGVAVAADTPSVFGTDDPALMGSEITISDSILAWTRKASADFTADDVCNGPREEAVAGTTADAAPPEFAAAMTRFGNGEQAGSAFHWVCTKGGSWGPDADDGARMLRLGENRLMMGWYDGVVVLLERNGSTL